MDSKEYVLKHDYGYGREPEQEILNKIELRNITDLKVYVEDLVSNVFVAEVKDNKVRFLDDNSIVEITIEKVA